MKKKENNNRKWYSRVGTRDYALDNSAWLPIEFTYIFKIKCSYNKIVVKIRAKLWYDRYK